MTKKLYDEDAYAKEFDAHVVSIEKKGDFFELILDRTLFFPEEGGQTPDKGTINGVKVLDVRIKDDIIVHVLKDEIKGDTVHGIIDFNHRFSNMQLHSGEHVFTGLVYKKYGYNNVGFHLSENTATMDYDGPLSFEEVRELELLANKIIVSNKKISAFYPDKDELQKLNYRSKKEINGAVRLVEIEDTDLCACCAPHVHFTGEIGFIKILNRENYKGGVRLTYLCGFRALSEFSRLQDALKDIQNALSVKPTMETEAVFKLKEDNQNLKFQNTSLIRCKLQEDINLLSEPVWIGSMDYASELKFIINEMHNKFPGTVYAFAGNDACGYRYIIESNNYDLTELAKLLKERFDAKGGGRKDSIQGNVKFTKENIYEIITN